MASDHIQLTVQPRSEFGSAASRRLRRQGFVPGILYQKGDASLAFQIGERELGRLLRGDGVRTSVVDITIGSGDVRPALFKDWDVDPVRGAVLHVDMAEVDLKIAIQAPVAVILTGTPVGVREGGVLDQPLHEITVEALPDVLPESLELDVSALEIGGALHVSDILPPDGVTIIDDPELVLASVTPPSTIEEVEEEEAVEAAEPQLVGETESGE